MKSTICDIVDEMLTNDYFKELISLIDNMIDI